METVFDQAFPLLYDVEGEKHLFQMEQAGIDMSAMFLFDVDLLVGEAEVNIEDRNMAVFEMARRFPDKIIPFVTVDPRRPGSKDFVKMCREEHGAKGLKLHPGAGFSPESWEVLDLVESIADYSMPVVVHTGESVPPTSSRYSNPVYLDKMLLEFPDAPVIAAHMGNGMHAQLFGLARYRPNLFTDLSAWQTTARFQYQEFARIVRSAIDHMGPDRILFGTDSPFFWPVVPEADYVSMIKRLSSDEAGGARLTEEEVEKILGLNARRLFGL
jgi:predicted TIM-barrel fold metal-dependent hydrolase